MRNEAGGNPDAHQAAAEEVGGLGPAEDVLTLHQTEAAAGRPDEDATAQELPGQRRGHR
jgi:hypothetical protein